VTGRLLFAYANPHLLLTKLLCSLDVAAKAGAKEPQEPAAAVVPAVPLPIRGRCHSFAFGDDSSRKSHSPASITWQPSPAPSLPSSLEGAAG